MAEKDKKKWLKGELLLDAGKLQGSFFHHTVLLVCEHNAEGALGLVLNRSSGNKASGLIETRLPESLEDHSVFLGGPVQPDALTFLHHDPTLLTGNVLSQLNLGHSLEKLIEAGESYAPARQVKIFAGYSGWSPGQLESEIKRGSWLTHPASLDLIFREPHADLWSHILALKGWEKKLLGQMPDDLSLN